MIFGTRAPAQAKGCILAHMVPLPDGKRLPKGRVIEPEDIAALTMAGISEVVVAALEPLDVGEDAAATRLAQSMVPSPQDANLRLTKATAGRVNLVANAPGIVGVDSDGLTRMNLIDEAITVATLPQFHRVSPGDLVATIKIIPFAVKQAQLSRVLAESADTIRVRSVVAQTASFVQTVLPGQAPSVRAEEVTRARLTRLGITLRETVRVAHDADAVAETLLQLSGDVALILTATATTDRADVAPSAVVQAGGVITRFGIPVDPGNLLFAGGLGDMPIIGLPGCARAPALNGADWILERLVCGVPITDADIAAMGVGGLLKDVVARGHPRRTDEQS